METVKILVVTRGLGGGRNGREDLGRATVVPQWWMDVIVRLSKPIECTKQK